MRASLIAAGTSPPPPMPTTVQQDFPLIGVGALTLAVSGFLFKWLFDQTVKNWEKRMERMEAVADDFREAEVSREALIEQLVKSTEQLNKQVESMSASQGQLALLSERQNVFDQRLQNYGGALQDTQRLYNESAKAFLELKGSLAVDYLRREDWLRFSNILETKLDENNRRFEDLKEVFGERLKRD